MNIAILGAGNVGLAFANLLYKGGHQVKLGSRDPRQFKRRLHDEVPKFSAEFEICGLADAVIDSDLTLLAVPDDSIQSAYTRIAERLRPGSIVAHLSGALDSSILSSAADQGLHYCSLHPLNSFPSLESSIALSQTSHGSHLYCEGQATALDSTDVLFKHCGFVPIRIEANAKPLYHAASVFACNYLSVLMGACMQAARAAELDEKMLWTGLQPLIQTTLHNIGEHGPANSLSGPIARGDLQTVKKHRNELNIVTPKLSELYTALGQQAIDLVEARGSLSQAIIDDMREELK